MSLMHKNICLIIIPQILPSCKFGKHGTSSSAWTTSASHKIIIVNRQSKGVTCSTTMPSVNKKTTLKEIANQMNASFAVVTCTPVEYKNCGWTSCRKPQKIAAYEKAPAKLYYSIWNHACYFRCHIDKQKCHIVQPVRFLLGYCHQDSQVNIPTVATTG